MMIAMPGVIWLLAEKPIDPDSFDMSVLFARIMFPYILLVSLVTLFTGMLNSVSRFAPGASFPIILNIVLIAALLGGDYAAETLGWSVERVGLAVAWAVPVAGVMQLVWLYVWTRVEGFRPRVLWPRITPEVKRLSIIALPAAIGGGAYQINTLVQLYFLNQLDEGSVSYMNYADRLNQLPLGIIGIALSTAILPTLSKFVGGDNKEGADRIQSDAIELSMLLTIPAAVALAVCAVPFVTMIFQGGRFSVEDAIIAGGVLGVLVLGLPAYVLVKVLVPNFYARADTRTPVYAAFISLAVFMIGCVWNIGLTAGPVQIEPLGFGVPGIAASSVVGAWINVAFLYIVLAKRGYYTMPLALLGRIARQLLAAAALGAALWFTRDALTGWYSAGLFARLGALLALVLCSGVVYFAVAFAVGAIDKQRIVALTKKRAP